MLDTATSAPFLVHIVHPIVPVNISSLGSRNAHTVETQSFPIVEDLGPSLGDVGTTELRCTGQASTFGNDTLPLYEAGTVNDRVIGSGMHGVEWPDLGHLHALNVFPERLLLH